MPVPQSAHIALAGTSPAQVLVLLLQPAHIALAGTSLSQVAIPRPHRHSAP